MPDRPDTEGVHVLRPVSILSDGDLWFALSYIASCLRDVRARSYLTQVGDHIAALRDRLDVPKPGP